MTKLMSLTKSRSSTQIVARQHMKKHLKRIRNKEYSRLRDMVPAIANKQKVSKVTVIEEAVRYIDELHRALVTRLGSEDIQCCKEDDSALKDFVHSFIPADFYERKAPVLSFEKHQKIPTYLKHDPTKRPTRFS